MKSKGLFLLLSAAMAAIGFANCTKTNVPSGTVTPSSTITAIIKAGTNTTLFESALTRTGLDSIFSGTGPFTVFVVTDNSLIASGITDSVIQNYPDSALRNLVLYQTIGARLVSASLPSGPNAKIISANGDSVFVTVDSSGIFINGVQATTVDVIAGNGVIHVISKLLIPPSGNILQSVQADTSLSMLAAAMTLVSQHDSLNVDSLLSVGGPYTLFAPVNAAFRAAGYFSPGDLANVNADSLTNIIAYHIVPGRLFSPAFFGTPTPVTLNDSIFTISSLGNNVFSVTGIQNSTPANTISINVMASNGIIHRIDQVLLP